MSLIDSHCHLDDISYAPELDLVIRRAVDNGVSHFLTIGTKLSNADVPVKIAEIYPFVYASVGVHPEYAAEELPAVSVELLCEKAAHPKVIGFGETGLDYHYNSLTKEAQNEVFRMHLKAAKQIGLPVIIHSRDAEQDTMQAMQDEAGEGLKGVLHCFSSKAELAWAALEMGFYISASGIITFKKSEELREIFKQIPLDRLLVETDAPYLAPMPFRGKRNEPAYVSKTAEILADIKNVSPEVLARQTTENFFTLFSKAA